MKKPFQILAFLLFGFLSVSATDNYRGGARSRALSNALVSVTDPWSTFHNQATLANYNRFSAGIFYESMYLIDELSLAAGTVVLPAVGGTLGLSFYQLGEGTYKESKAGLAYSKRLSKKLNAAVQFDYFHTRFPENEKGSSFPTFELGMSYQATRELTLGLHLFNPIKNGFRTQYQRQKTAAIIRFGGHYQFQDKALLALEIEKNSAQNAQIKSGLEFTPLENFAVRLGVSGRPLQLSAGIGYSFSKIVTNIGFSYHETLGITPSVALNYQLP